MKHHSGVLPRILLRTLGLTLAILVAGTSTVRAQELNPERLQHVVGAFNELGRALGEQQFDYTRLTDDYMENIRSSVCEKLNGENDLGGLASALLASLQVSAERLEAAQQIARSGDSFNEFLRAERTAFRIDEIGLNETAQALALQLMIAHRGHIARDGVPTKTVQDLPSILTEGVLLLCHEQHSPATNESSASWLSWTWAGTKLVGGLVVAGVDVTPNALLPQYRRLSVSLGLRAVKSGFSDLDALIRRTGEDGN